MTPLDPLSFPLTGCHLIEASAGTGKTYTIAFLYLRLVLGHGTLPSGRALTPPEILVMTFTEAATHELRSRIRQRLSEAAQAFRTGPDQTTSGSPDLLEQLRASYPCSQWPVCALQLENAVAWMDEAAISTIHGWCQRMLREHAFASHSLFDLQLESQPNELLAEVVRDYWRTFYQPLNAPEVQTVATFWPTPDELFAALRPLLPDTDLIPLQEAPHPLLERITRERQQQLEFLKAPWRNWADELLSLLDEARALKLLNGQKLKSNHYQKWFSQLLEWAHGDPADLDIGAGWTRFAPEKFNEIWRTEAIGHLLYQRLATHPGITALLILNEQLNQLPDARPALLGHAVHWVRQTFAALRQQRALITFDDLLSHLESALRGPHAERLAQQIRQQFPVALIDEFQDTDPVQYRLFERIYDIANNPQDCALILIGDPKQAIYAFRGADIHTYLQASRAVHDRRHTLNTNFRSTHEQVAAVNGIFATIEQQSDSRGAFLFRQANDPLPFFPVQAKGRSDRFLVQGHPASALTLVLGQPISDKPLSKTDYVEQMAEACANQIVTWLNEPACFSEGTNSRPMKPGDVAILVDNRFQAQDIRQTLARHGLRSVFLSEQGSVYDTPQAREVQCWLNAMARPDDPRALRTALASPSLHRTVTELDQLNHDERAWEVRLLQFKGYHDLWQEQGVLPVLRRLMGDFQVHDYLLGLETEILGQSGERVLTDLLHLAELLQQASAALESELGLLRILEQAIQNPDLIRSGESQRLRLESDQDRIQVVTIHKSKGLEYPLVMLPFISASRPVKDKDLPLGWHDDAGQRRLFFRASAEELQHADEERLAEDLRKTYVALTRARHATWIGLAPLETRAAMDYLLGTRGMLDPMRYELQLTTFVHPHPSMTLIRPSDLAVDRVRTARNTPHCNEVCQARRNASDGWWIASYSALIGEHSTNYQQDSATFEKFQEEQQTREPSGQNASLAAVWHRFPRGALAGTLLHDLLEWAANRGFHTLLEHPLEWREAIARRCQVRQWPMWIDPLLSWLQCLLSKPIPVMGDRVSLAQLTICQAEMEFWLTTQRVSLTRLDALLAHHTLSGCQRPPLTHGTLNGMLKGFIDLVFEHQGRYYVLDYKSNWLGPNNDGYDHQSLIQAMAEHRYDLQYALYLLALHRLLRSRLVDYDYDRHVGGVRYWFLRGLDAANMGIYDERPPKVLIEALDELLAGQP